MSEKGALIDLHGIAMVDAVTTALVSGILEYEQVALYPFNEVLMKLAEACAQHPDIVGASAEVRQWYDLCHFDCHVRRVQMFMQQNREWKPGQGPNQPKAEVFQFPDPSTRH